MERVVLASRLARARVPAAARRSCAVYTHAPKGAVDLKGRGGGVDHLVAPTLRRFGEEAVAAYPRHGRAWPPLQREVVGEPVAGARARRRDAVGEHRGPRRRHSEGGGKPSGRPLAAHVRVHRHHIVHRRQTPVALIEAG
eukprot:scaffold36926_cov63-Phaeocystis_antarctica.AAC.4